MLEIGAMHYLSKRPPHGNVMFMHAVYEDASFLFLELECLGGGDLFEAVQGSPGGKFPEARARRVLRQVLQGLCFMHGHGIIHRDLSLGELGVSSLGRPPASASASPRRGVPPVVRPRRRPRHALCLSVHRLSLVALRRECDAGVPGPWRRGQDH